MWVVELRGELTAEGPEFSLKFLLVIAISLNPLLHPQSNIYLLPAHLAFVLLPP